MKGDDKKSYLKLNVEDLTKELKENKELIKMTSGKEDGEEEKVGRNFCRCCCCCQEGEG